MEQGNLFIFTKIHKLFLVFMFITAAKTDPYRSPLTPKQHKKGHLIFGGALLDSGAWALFTWYRRYFTRSNISSHCGHLYDVFPLMVTSFCAPNDSFIRGSPEDSPTPTPPEWFLAMCSIKVSTLVEHCAQTGHWNCFGLRTKVSWRPSEECLQKYEENYWFS